MKLQCPHCHKTYHLQEGRLPNREEISLPCPACKSIITLDLRTLKEAEGVRQNPLQFPSQGDSLAGEALKKRIVKSVQDLPPMPQTIFRAQEIIRNPHSSFADLAKVLEMDQALAAKVLKMANSPFYGLMGKVSSLQHASVVLGQKTLEELITMAGASDLLGGSLEGYELDSGDLWLHSMGVAFGSKIIAAKKYPALENDAFTAGIIHDVGKLALDPYVLERKQAFKSITEDGRENFTDAERRILGFDHSEIVFELCKNWNVPDPLRIAVKYHHNPEYSEGNILAYIVHLADAIAMMSGMGAGIDGLQYQLNHRALEKLGIHEEGVSEIMAEVVQSVQDISIEVEKA